MIIKGFATLVVGLCISSAIALTLIAFSNVISTLFPVRIDLRSYYKQKDNQIKKAQELRKTLRTGSDTEVRTMLAKFLK